MKQYDKDLPVQHLFSFLFQNLCTETTKQRKYLEAIDEIMLQFSTLITYSDPK